MAWYNNWGDLTGDLKSGVQSIAGLATNPIVDLGLGALTGGWAIPAIAGGLGGLLKQGGGLGSGVTGALTGGLSGEGGSLLKGLLTGSGGAGGLGSLAALGGLGSGVSSLANALGLGNGQGGVDVGKLAAMGLTAAQIANAASLQNQSNQYAKDALSGVQQNFNQRQPLRQFGMQSMLQPQIADLSTMLTNSGPYAAGLPKPGVQAVQRYTGTIPTVT